MTPIGQDTIELRITDISEQDLFVDEADIGNALVRTVHRIDPVGAGRSKLTYRIEITGPVVDRIGRQLGPEISSDLPQTLAGLVEQATCCWRQSCDA
jgi:hypothetical protein